MIHLEETFRLYALEDPVTIDIDNDADAFACDSEGHIIVAQSCHTRVSMYSGKTPQTLTGITHTIEGGTPEGITVATDLASGTITVTAAPGAVLTQNLRIVITASCALGSRDVVFCVIPQAGGAPGVSPTIYNLLLDITAFPFDRDADGHLIDATHTVNLRVIRRKGEVSDTLFSLDGHRIYVGFDNAPADYAHPIAVGGQHVVNAATATDHHAVRYELWRGEYGAEGAVCIDYESVAIVLDGVPGRHGQNAVTIDLDNENDILQYDILGHRVGTSVRTTATLYRGGTPITEGLTWTKEQSEGVTCELTTNGDNTATVEVTALSVPNGHVDICCNFEGVPYRQRFSVRRTEGLDKYEIIVSPNAISYNTTTATASASNIAIDIYRSDTHGVRSASALPEGWRLTCQYAGTSIPAANVPIDANGHGSVSVETSATAHVFTLVNADGTMHDSETVATSVVRNGDPGETGYPFLVDIDNEMTSIPVGQDGKTTEQRTITFGLEAFYGLTSVIADCSVDVLGTPAGWTVNTTNKSHPAVIIPALSTPDELTELTFTVSHPDYGSRTAVFSVAAVKSGGVGQDAVLYELFPSLSQISVARTEDGGYSPRVTAFQCGIKKTEGRTSSITDRAINGLDGYNIYSRVFNRIFSQWSNYMRYCPENIGLESIDASIVEKMELILCKNTEDSIHDYEIRGLVDRETIPVVADGMRGKPMTWDDLTEEQREALTGKNGDGVIVQYASDAAGTDAHEPPFVPATDRYMRMKIGESGTWDSWKLIVGENGDAGPYTDYAFAWATAESVADPTTAPTGIVGSWEDSPAERPQDGDYFLWMRVTPYNLPVRVDGTLTPGTTRYARIGGKDGEPGKDSVALNVSTNVIVVPTSTIPETGDVVVADGAAARNIELSVIAGNRALSISSVTYTTTGANSSIAVSKNNNIVTVTPTVGETWGTDKTINITVKAMYLGVEQTLRATINVTGSIQGATVRGPQGASVTGVREYYIRNNDIDNPPEFDEASWSTEHIEPTRNARYVWNCEVIDIYDQATQTTTHMPTGVHFCCAWNEGIKSQFSYYAVTQDSAMPDDAAFDTFRDNLPAAVAAMDGETNRFLWNWEYKEYIDGGAPRSEKRLLTVWGKQGDPADATLTLDLSDELTSFATDSDGHLPADDVRTTLLSLFAGHTPLDFTPSFIKRYSDGTICGDEVAISYKKNAVGEYEVTVRLRKTVSSADVVFSRSICIEMTAKPTDTTFGERTTVFTLQPVAGGSDGTSPVLYAIRPSVSAVKVNSSGVRTPTTLTFAVDKTVGETVTPITNFAEGPYLQYSIDNSTRWINITNGTTALNITAATKNIRLRLQSSQSTADVIVGNVIYDTETIPVVMDGTNGTSPITLTASTNVVVFPTETLDDGHVQITSGASARTLTLALASGTTGITLTAITPSFTSNQNCTVTKNVSTGTVTITPIKGSEWSGDLQLNITATGTFNGASVSRVVTINISGSMQGQTVQGPKGTSVRRIREYYKANDDYQNPPQPSDGGWSTEHIEPTSTARFVWNYEEVVFYEPSTDTDLPAQPTDVHLCCAWNAGISEHLSQYCVTEGAKPDPWPKIGYYNDVDTAVAHMDPDVKRFLWNREKTTYVDGTVDERIRLVCVWGERGPEGNGIEVDDFYFQLTATPVPPATDLSAPNHGWIKQGAADCPSDTTAARPFLWQLEHIAYSSDASLNKDVVRLIKVHNLQTQPQLLEQTAFDCLEQMDQWTLKNADGQILPDAMQGANGFALWPGTTTSTNILRQVIINPGTLCRVEPSKWYTFSFYARDRVNVGETSNKYGFATTTFHLKPGRYRLEICGHCSRAARASSAPVALRGYLYPAGWTSQSVFVELSSVTDTVVRSSEILITDATAGEYSVTFYAYKGQGQGGADGETVTAKWFRVICTERQGGTKDNNAISTRFNVSTGTNSIIAMPSTVFVDGVAVNKTGSSYDGSVDWRLGDYETDADGWSRHSLTFRTKDTLPDKFSSVSSVYLSQYLTFVTYNTYVEIACPKLEASILPTEWCEHLADASMHCDHNPCGTWRSGERYYYCNGQRDVVRARKSAADSSTTWWRMRRRTSGVGYVSTQQPYLDTAHWEQGNNLRFAIVEAMFAEEIFTDKLTVTRIQGANGKFTVDKDGNVTGKDCQFENGSFSGTLQAARGTFSGFVKMQPVEITAANYLQYAKVSSTEGDFKFYILDFDKLGPLVVLRSFPNDTSTASYGRHFYFPGTRGDKNEARAYIGSTVLIYNRSSEQTAVSGDIVLNESTMAYVSTAIPVGKVYRFECRLRFINGREVIYWYCDSGTPAD